MAKIYDMEAYRAKKTTKILLDKELSIEQIFLLDADDEYSSILFQEKIMDMIDNMLKDLKKDNQHE